MKHYTTKEDGLYSLLYTGDSTALIEHDHSQWGYRQSSGTFMNLLSRLAGT